MMTNETIQAIQADPQIEELSDLELEAIAGGGANQTFLKPAHTVTQLPAHGGLQTSIPAFSAGSLSPANRGQIAFVKQTKAELSPRIHRPQFEIGY
jgi:hypothetical protein